jgi:hypothetical protein
MEPFVQGPSHRRPERIRASITLGAAFVCAATMVFALVYLVGEAVGVGQVPTDWRIGLAAGGLFALSALDVRATRRATYCPLSWRRQTPKSLVSRRSATLVAAAWGFDTGLPVTTVRVAAITWGAVLLACLGLSAWSVGLAYGLGFAVPFVILLWTHRVGQLARSPTPVDPGLESMLAKRGTIQAISAGLLITSAGILVGLIVTP